MVKVAVLGFGTVGSGVVEVMEENADKIAQNAATEFEVKYILDVRDFPGHPLEKLFIKDFAIIENDPEIKVVIETIGGVGAALDFTRRSLLAGKNVVTSNKELVATHGCELLGIAHKKNLNYLFEASVGGGIPIIRPISQCLAANEIDEIYGILNGTTNYILTQMIQNGLPFDTALKQAQENGYAEADPTADVEGHDACRKICILASLSFGHHIYPDQVPTEGIRGVSLEDVLCAKGMNCKIKLIGRAKRNKNGKISCYVAPHLIGMASPLANVEGVFNGIAVHGNAIGDVMFYGAGAGKLPTASAVVADVIDCAKHFRARKYIDWKEGGPDVADDPELLETRWYVRAPITASEAERVFGEITVLAGEHMSKDRIAFSVGSRSRKEIDKKLSEINAISAFRILD